MLKHIDRRVTRVFISVIIAVVLLSSSYALAQAVLKVGPPTETLLDPSQRFDPDLFSGSASYSYPINLPKGTNDLTPNVSLSYNSSATRDSSNYAGMGWEVNRDYRNGQ